MAAATIIDGAAIARRVREEVKAGVEKFHAEHGRVPGLCTILVGDDPASAIYVGGKERACGEVGMASFHRHLPATVSDAELLDEVARAAADDHVDGILVQLPLPSHLDAIAVIEAIPPDKDVDGFHPTNVGRLSTGQRALPQCTPAGIMRLLDEHAIDVAGRDAVVVGRSNIVGKPMAAMLLARHATVTIAHSRTADLAAHTRRADVVVMAVGRDRMLTGDMVKPGATVIDVGMNRTDGGLFGDVDFASVNEVAGAITPVPGGVGPMTIAMLLANTLQAALWREAAVGATA